MRIKYLITIISFICNCGFLKSSLAQGHISHIVNQPYMKYADKVNCDSLSDNLTAKICANLQYQKADSMLLVLYNRLILLQPDSAAVKAITELQKSWRKLRNDHCKLVWEKFDTGNNLKAIAYLDCLTYLTNNRIAELNMLLKTDE